MENEEKINELPALARTKFRNCFSWLFWFNIIIPILGALVTTWYALEYNKQYIPIQLAIYLAFGFFFPMFFLYRHFKHPVFVFCPSCGDTVPPFDPWQCGFCKRPTTLTMRYSFLNKCSQSDCRQPPPAYQCPSCGESIVLNLDGELHHVAQKWEPEVTEEQIQERHEAFKRTRVRIGEQRQFQKEDVAHEHWKDTVKEKQNIEKVHLKASLTEEQIRLTEVQQYAEKLQSSSEPNSKIEALENDLEREIGQFHDAKKVGRKKIQEIENSDLSDREKARMIRKIKDWTLKHGYEME